jgi:diketogulonate reductase-like aldo/keto reductase
MVKGQYCQRSEKVIKEKNLDLFNENILKELAKKYDKTLGQIILNWHIHVGVVPIPGTFSPNRMKENLGATEFDMEEEDIQKINNSFKDKQYRFCDSYPVYGIDIFA